MLAEPARLTRTLSSPADQTPPLSLTDRLRNWWSGCSREGLRLAEGAWLQSSIQTPTTVRDIDIGAGQFLHTLSVAGSSSTPPLVVLHGYGQGLGVWAKTVDPLTEGLGPEHGGVHLVDWLGCGLSSRPSFRSKNLLETEAFFVDSLERWRESMGIEQFAIAGHSFGGYMAGAYALKHPERVSSLVLVSPAGLGGAPHESTSHDYSWKVRSLIGIAGSLHWLGVTPHGFFKFLGASNARKLLTRYERNGGERRGATEAEIELLTEYHHHVLAADSASGECALNKVLVLGAGGVSPQAPRLVDDLPLTTPLHFVYGTNDWVRSVTDASLPPTGGGVVSVAANVLEGRKARATAEAALYGGGGGGGNGVVGSMQVVQRGTHNMMLDEPEETARCIVKALAPAVTVDVADISLALGKL